MRVGESVLVLTGGIFGIDRADRIEDVAVRASLDDELAGVDLIGCFPLEVDLIVMRGSGKPEEGEGQRIAAAAEEEAAESPMGRGKEGE